MARTATTDHAATALSASNGEGQGEMSNSLHPPSRIPHLGDEVMKVFKI